MDLVRWTSIEIEADDDVEILDPTIHIANVDHGGSLRIEMRLKRARGYRRGERNFEEDLEIGYLPIDSVHSPVEKVNYTVEPARFDLKRCDKLSIEIWTNGSVRPEEAILRSYR
jgi:DNA-directed RNA polymerase subunit alpha